jgi:hypothetical protein
MTRQTATPDPDPLFDGIAPERLDELTRRFRTSPDLEEMIASGELQRLILAEPRVGVNLLGHLARRFRRLSAGQPAASTAASLPTG